MLTLLLKANKRLVISKNARIYQREANIDVFNLYIPEKYDDKDISDCTVVMQYIDPGNVAHSETLDKVTELDDDTGLIKEGYSLYWLPIDTKFTAVAGNIRMQLMLTDMDQDNNQTVIMRSSELTIPVLTVSDYFAYVDDSSLSAIDNRIAELKALAEELENTEGRLDKTIPTDLTMDKDFIKLKTEDGTAIGDGVELNAGGYEVDPVDDGIADLSAIDGSGSEGQGSDPDNVDDGVSDLSNL